MKQTRIEIQTKTLDNSGTATINQEKMQSFPNIFNVKTQQ